MAKNPEAKVSIKLFNEDFNNSVKEMKEESGKLRKEFVLQEQQMKLTASEAEKLGSKVDFLTQQHALATRKVAETEAQYEKVKAQFGENSVAAKKMADAVLESQIAQQKLSNELAQTDGALEKAKLGEQKLGSEINSTTNKLQEQNKKLNETADKLKAVGDNAKSAGESLSQNLTLPLVGVGVGAGVVANEFDSAQGRIQAQLALTKEEAAQLAYVAQDVWKNAFGESVTEVSNNLAIIKQNMGDLSDVDLQKIAEGAYTIKDAFEAEINETTRTASVLMKNFAIDSTTALDLITTGFQRGGNFSDELLDTLREYAPQFKGMGYNAEEFTAILIAGAEAGAFNLDKVGDAAKEAFLRIGDGSKSSRDALGSLGLDFNKIENDINSGGESAKTAFAAVTTAIATIEDPAARAQTAVALLGTPIEDLGPEFQTFFTTVNTDLGNFEGATSRAGQSLYDNFGSRATVAFRQFQEALVPLGIIILDAADRILPILIAAIQVLSGWFANMSPLLQTVIVVVGALFAALGPLLILLGVFINAIGGIIGFLAPLILAITEAGGVIAFLSTKLAFLTPLFTALTGPIGITIAAIAGIIAIVVLAYNKVDWFREGVKNIFNSIKESTAVSFGAIKQTINSIIGGVVSYVKSQLDVFKKFWDENGKQITAIVIMSFGIIKSNIELVMGIIKGIFQVVFPLLAATVRYAFETIKLVVSTAINLVLGIIQTVLKILQGDWKGAWDTILQTVKDIWSDVGSFLKGIDLKQTGKDIIQGLIDGIGSMAGAVWKKVSGIVDGIKSAITGALKIKSPSRVTMEYGVNIGQGLINGIQEMNAAVKNSAYQMAQMAIPSSSNNDTMASANNSTASNSIGNVYITIPANDIKEFKDVTYFFKRLQQTVNAY